MIRSAGLIKYIEFECTHRIALLGGYSLFRLAKRFHTSRYFRMVTQPFSKYSHRHNVDFQFSILQSNLSSS